MAANRTEKIAGAGARYVLVVGSANVDVSVSTAVLPRPGETVFGDGSVISIGGKGANQAVAAASCGAATKFVARTGDDAFGSMVREALGARGVQIDEVRALAGTTTGLAAIYVEKSGQNCIVVVPGANAQLMPSDVEQIRPLIRDAAIVVLQCEIPMETVYRTIEIAVECDTQLILNPAPYRRLDLARSGRGITYLVPNENEASQIGAMPVETVAQAEQCASGLRAQGIDCVIVTLGAQGCLVVDHGPARHFAAHRVTSVDTTGAGDAFVGCLAASLATGRSRDESIRRAVVYSALSVTQRGAQLSYPRREDYERVWSRVDETGAG